MIIYEQHELQKKTKKKNDINTQAVVDNVNSCDFKDSPNTPKNA